MSEPRRLLDDASELEPALRAALRYARAAGPSEAMLAKLTSGALAEVERTVPVANTRGRITRHVVLASIALVGIVLWATLQQAPRKPQRAPHAAPEIVAHEVVVPPVASDDHERAEPAPALAAPTATKKRPAARPRTALVPNSDGDQEIALLLRARRLVSGAPERALLLLDEHQTRYQRGDFREEREALAIEALWRLGQRAEATRRLAVFEAAYPRSAYLARSRELLGDAGPP